MEENKPLQKQQKGKLLEKLLLQKLKKKEEEEKKKFINWAIVITSYFFLIYGFFYLDPDRTYSLEGDTRKKAAAPKKISKY